MKQKERIINDVLECLKFYELGHFDEAGTIKSISHITAQGCEHCVYNSDECRQDHKKTCSSGFAKYLESEV